MSNLDIESLLFEVSPEAPCGEDLTYDNAFLELEGMVPKTVEGTTEDAPPPVAEPNWREVRDKSLELLRRSKDLRVALYLALALLKTEGLAGLRDGLAVLRGLLERHWDGLYPRLDPDDNDPFERMTALTSLSPQSVSKQDRMKFRKRILETPLCNSPRLGKFSFRDVQVAKGHISVSDEEAAKAPQMSKIDAGFRDTPPEQLEMTWQAIREALGHTAAITNVVSERSANNEAPDLSMLEKLLKGIAGFVQGYIGSPGVTSAMQGGAQGMGENNQVVPGGAAATPGMNEIRSREDVVFVLRKICDYFARNEPSSPIPLLLRRAQRLVSKSFVEVIEDVCPDAMNQVEIIGGSSSRSDSDYETGQAEQ